MQELITLLGIVIIGYPLWFIAIEIERRKEKIEKTD